MRDTLRLGVLATHPVQYHAPLFRALVAAGVDLTVYFAHSPSARDQGTGFGVAFQWDVDLTSGYRHVFLPNRAKHPSASSFWGSDVPEVRAAIAGGAFDAFLVSGWHARAYWQAVSACNAAGVPVMVRGDSQLLTDASALKRTAKRALYPRLLRRFDVCLSVGTRSEEYFRYYGARTVVRAPHFVDNAFFATRAATAAAERSRLRAEFGLPADATVVLFAGKLLSWKRPLDLLDAVRALDDPRVAVLFAGDGELRAECESRARGMVSTVRFAGFLNQTEMPRAYAACDVLVLPSEARETWGLVVNEAMASGRPALVADSAGCSPDLVTNGETGYTFPVGDVGALTERLRQVVSNPAALASLSSRARERVAAFSVDAAAAGVIAAAERASGRRAA